MTSGSGQDRHYGTLWVQEVGWPAPGKIEPLIPASFVRFKPEMAGELAGVMGLTEPTEVQVRFLRGRRCYGALVEEKIAAYGWVTFDEEKIGEMQMSIRLAPGEAYIWECATLPLFRQRRLYTALLVTIVSALRAEGLQRIWIGTDRENVTSQMGMASAGFLQVADIARESGRIWFQGKPGIPKKTIEDARRALIADRPRVSNLSGYSHGTYQHILAQIQSVFKR